VPSNRKIVTRVMSLNWMMIWSPNEIMRSQPGKILNSMLDFRQSVATRIVISYATFISVEKSKTRTNFQESIRTCILLLCRENFKGFLPIP